MATNRKSEGVTIQRDGKTHYGVYTVARGTMTVHGEGESKTTELGDSSAEFLAKVLLREIVEKGIG